MSEQPTEPIPPLPVHWWQQPPSFWPGLVAGVLAFAVAISIVALAVSASIAEARHDTSISQPAAALLSTSLGGALGAVATYIGLSYAERRAAVTKAPPDAPDPP